MNELGQLLDQYLNRELQQIILSNSLDAGQAAKVKIRPVLLKGELFFQETLYRGTQVFHKNYTKQDMNGRICELMETLFKQCECKADGREATVLVSKKGKMTIKERERGRNVQAMQPSGAKQAPTQTDSAERLEHNRTKQYILQEGTPVDFLVGLGVQLEDGRISKAKYAKFRQINRYLEFIADVTDALPSDRCIRIIDFGCGKSYLTFAMYYFLHEMQHREIEVIGLDLKAEVIAHCNELAGKLHYDGLHFERGDISTYEGADAVDMVVSLHACDTATDYALEKAIQWGARVIMAVPCCQHEVNRQIRCDELQPILKYGLLKERFAAIATDAVRANLLEQNGYDTQILEFIDMEHTPKNLLIRAVKGQNGHKMRPKERNGNLKEMEAFLQIAPTLERLLTADRSEA